MCVDSAHSRHITNLDTNRNYEIKHNIFETLCHQKPLTICDAAINDARTATLQL